MLANSQDKKNLTPASSGVKTQNREQYKDVPVRVDLIPIVGLSAQKGKSLKSCKKSARPVRSTNINKKEFILKFVKQDASLVWSREMKMVNSLFKIFPNDEFWNSLELKFKLNSLCWFLSDDGRKFLNTEYKKFQFQPEKPEVFDLKKNNIAFQGKIGETVQAPMTVREFLKLWQKKN
jgi:hypothetical protein